MNSYPSTAAPPATPAHAPLASVIIPCYNHGRWLGDAIRSVLAQDYPSHEIIVVDDGSTDNTRAVVASFGEQIRYVWQQNQGLSAARNTGLNLATGDYIALLDADDMLEPLFLSTLTGMLKANPRAGGIVCGYRFVDHQNQPLPQIENRLTPTGQLYQALLQGNFLVPESILLRSNCYRRVGNFDVSLTACEDWDMWLRIASQFEIIITDKVLTRHRVLPGSMSTNPDRMLKNRLAVLQKHFGCASDCEQAGQAIGYAYLTSAIEYLQQGHGDDLETAYRCFREAIAHTPDLLTAIETFYELGVGDRPKGARGDLAQVDVRANAEVVFGFLDRLEREAKMPTDSIHFKRRVRATAYFAFGKIAYNGGHLHLARPFLLKALSLQPYSEQSWDVASLYVKSLMGARVIGWLQQRKPVPPTSR